MTGALLYLARRSAANRVARQLAQLRRPRYLIAVLLGVAYLWLVLFRQRAEPTADAAIAGRWIELAGSVALFALVAWTWIAGAERRALVFSPAEVTFLFPAPLTRRTLIRYKLFRSQLVVLFNSLLWTLIFARERFGASPWLRALAIWTLFSTLTLHRLGASFVRTSLSQHGRAAWRRRAVSVTLLALVVAAVAWTAFESYPAVSAARRAGGPQLLAALESAAARPVPAALLLPFRWLVRPLAATGPRAWLAAMLPAIGLLFAHYLWVIRSDAAFEEAAAEASLARARRRSQSAGGGMSLERGVRSPSRPLFALGPRGSPGTAILWKNLTAVARRRRAGNSILGFAAAGALAALLSPAGDGGIAELAGALAIAWSGLLLLLGPQWIRNDLRSDLRKLDLLRSYPVRGWVIVAAEALASTATLCALEFLMLGFVYLAFLRHPTIEISLQERSLLLVAAVLLLPGVNFMAMLLQNAAALLYPAWVRLGRGMTGVEALGQNLLAMLVFTVLLGVLLAPPVGVGAGVAWLFGGRMDGWVWAAAMLAGLAATSVEAALVIRWLGHVFERTDRTALPIGQP